MLHGLSIDEKHLFSRDREARSPPAAIRFISRVKQMLPGGKVGKKVEMTTNVGYESR